MIEIRDLSLTYQGPKGPVHALRGINLEIASGEVFGIIGRSGAGKSSLVRCLNLLNRPTEGKVIVNGRDLMQLSVGELRAARRDIGWARHERAHDLRQRHGREVAAIDRRTS